MASVPTLFWANSYDLFVLFVSVSIIFDIHATSDIDNLSCGVLSALQGRTHIKTTGSSVKHCKAIYIACC